MLRGNSPARIDEKGRLKIPTVFRADIEDSWDSDFYITSMTGDSAWIYPLIVWEAIEERLAKLPSLHPTKKKFLDRTNYYGQLTSMDKQGRVLIPPLLRESANVVGEVAVLGCLNYLDVWNNETFKKGLKDEPLTSEDLRVLSELGV